MEWNVESLAMAAAFLSGLSLVMLVVVLALAMRLTRQERRLEAWLDREIQRLQEALGAIRSGVGFSQQGGLGQAGTYGEAPAAPLGAFAAGMTAPFAPIVPSTFSPPRRYGAPGAAAIPTGIKMPDTGLELLDTVNTLLAGNQPYNMAETLHGMNPRLNLQRMSPRGTADGWGRGVVFDPGGDGLFAWIDQNRAFLFPNYDRFSGSFDPKPMFEGARQGTRIQAVLQPAMLIRGGDGAWHLSEKGRVQMK